MEIAFIGLGRMGANMGTRLLRDGHTVLGYDPSAEARERLTTEGGQTSESLSALAALFTQTPKVFWIMVPSGAPVDDTLQALLPVVSPGDVIVDGGNSNYRDSQRRAAESSRHKVRWLDCGTSGGVWGLTEGYCMMLGGDEGAFRVVEPALRSLAPNEDGYQYVGPAGAGHFAKMVHNGIEYGLMQAYAEGFEILEKSGFRYDLHRLSRLWNQGSVVRSWLLELAEHAFAQNAHLDDIAGYVEDTGEGRWTVQAAIDEGVPAPVITLALQMRLRSRQADSFAAKVVAALRQQFGGHAVREAGQGAYAREP